MILKLFMQKQKKLGIKLIEPDGGKNLGNELSRKMKMTLPSFKKLLEEKKMADTYAQIKPNRLGKRINKIEDIKSSRKKGQWVV